MSLCARDPDELYVKTEFPSTSRLRQRVRVARRNGESQAPALRSLVPLLRPLTSHGDWEYSYTLPSLLKKTSDFACVHFGPAGLTYILLFVAGVSLHAHMSLFAAGGRNSSSHILENTE